MEWREWLQLPDYFEGLKGIADDLKRVVDQKPGATRPHASPQGGNRWIYINEPLDGVRLIAAYVPHTDLGPSTLNLNVWLYETEKVEGLKRAFKTAPKFTSGGYTFGVTHGFRNQGYERSVAPTKLSGVNYTLQLDNKFLPGASGIKAISAFVHDFCIYVRGIVQPGILPQGTAAAAATQPANGQMEPDEVRDLSLKRFADSSGKEVPERMQRFFNQLEELGFAVKLTTWKKEGAVSRTFRITWAGKFVGKWDHRQWQTAHKFVLLYRFHDQGVMAGFEAPQWLTEAGFSEQHGVDASHVQINREKSGSRYLNVRAEATAISLLQQTAEFIEERVMPPLRGTDRQVANDISNIMADTSLTPTERMEMAKVRVGQGRFRIRLLREFAHKCAVSGLDVTDALRASHIVPWRTSTNEDRLNPKNGLLLSANIDALFDRFLITFDRGGNLVASPALSEQQRDQLGLGAGLAMPLCDERWAFMKLHTKEYAKRLNVSALEAADQDVD